MRPRWLRGPSCRRRRSSAPRARTASRRAAPARARGSSSSCGSACRSARSAPAPASGAPWPSVLTAMPARPSRYLRPSVSHSQQPRPCESAIGQAPVGLHHVRFALAGAAAGSFSGAFIGELQDRRGAPGSVARAGRADSKARHSSAGSRCCSAAAAPVRDDNAASGLSFSRCGRASRILHPGRDARRQGIPAQRLGRAARRGDVVLPSGRRRPAARAPTSATRPTACRACWATFSGVLVNEALREMEPMAWDFVMNFARDNDLVVIDPPAAEGNAAGADARMKKGSHCEPRFAEHELLRRWRAPSPWPTGGSCDARPCSCGTGPCRRPSR